MQKLPAPVPPVVAPPIPVPWIAALTPVMLALAMSLIFQQVLALMMGLIGPAMVLGSWWESRRQASRAHARSQEEFAVATAEHAREISDLRAREKAHALALLPPLPVPEGMLLVWRENALNWRLEPGGGSDRIDAVGNAHCFVGQDSRVRVQPQR